MPRCPKVSAFSGVPGFRLHPLRGDRVGQWSVRVSGNWRVMFRFENGEAGVSANMALALTGSAPSVRGLRWTCPASLT